MNGLGRFGGGRRLHSLPAAALRLEPTNKATFGESVSSTARKIGHKALGLTGFGSGQAGSLHDLTQSQLMQIADGVGALVPEGATKAELIEALNNLD